jgi:signal transduction histidine kinase
VLATGLPLVNEELVLERPDFSRVHVLANIAPLRDVSGLAWGAVNILQDVTEIKNRQQEREQLLQELERSNRALSEFSFAVSHDLQAPVRSVRALTQLLVQRDGKPPEDAPRLAALIEQASETMQCLIESMLQYAQAGRGELNSRPVSANALIESVLVSLASQIASTGARVVCETLPEVDADPVQLQQIFQNLIANAINYHEPGRTPLIEIRGEPFEDGWRFAIIDNGQGIPREFQTIIFEPLKRLHGTSTPGTGLGLAMCKAIILRHGGRIWVESQGTGHGSAFRFTLPRVAPRSRAVGNIAAGSAISIQSGCA